MAKHEKGDESMTYEGLFEKCETLAELHELKSKLLLENSKYKTQLFRDLGRFEIEDAFERRRKEIRQNWEETSYG